MWNAKCIVVATLFANLLASRAILADDAADLQGLWVVRSATRAGEAFDEPVGDKLEFADSQITVHLKDDTTRPMATFKLDESKMPKHLDVTVGEKTAEGIYRLDQDSLQLSLSSPGEPRPQSLESNEGDKHLSLVLERISEDN